MSLGARRGPGRTSDGRVGRFLVLAERTFVNSATPKNRVHDDIHALAQPNLQPPSYRVQPVIHTAHILRVINQLDRRR